MPPPVIILPRPGVRVRHRCAPCGKLAYRSEGSAEHALRQIERDPHGDKIPVRAYYSDPRAGGCGWWHLTSKPKER